MFISELNLKIILGEGYEIRENVAKSEIGIQRLFFDKDDLVLGRGLNIDDRDHWGDQHLWIQA